jgi:cytosine/adenosine deaminase-related metal-dependent hydrolase
VAADRDIGPGGGDFDAGGAIILPAFTDAHVHLDSNRLGLPFRPHTSDGTLFGQIMNDRAHWRSAEASMTERATHALGLLIDSGVTRARSYAQIDTDAGLERFEAVLAARETHRDSADVQIIAFPQAGIVREPGASELLDEALRSGADLIGGIDPCGLDRDPVEHLDVVFGLAEHHQVGIDIHLHDGGTLGLFTIELIAERTRALGLQGRVTISHAFALGEAAPELVARTLDMLAEVDIALTTIAPGGRPPLPIEEIAARGIRLGLGQDGQRDYWSPFGSADMLDRAWQLAFTNNFRRDELVEHALAIATAGGASVMDGPVATRGGADRSAMGAGLRLSGIGSRPGFTPGSPADFVLVDGETPTSAVMDRPRGRTVIHEGRIVRDTRTPAGTPDDATPERHA